MSRPPALPRGNETRCSRNRAYSNTIAVADSVANTKRGARGIFIVDVADLIDLGTVSGGSATQYQVLSSDAYARQEPFCSAAEAEYIAT
jgi:hypothetical protein